MSMDTGTMSPADFAAMNGGGNGGFGGGWASWIILFVVFFMFGGFGGFGRGYGNGNGSDNSGAANNYVLASDFATVQRQLSDGFNGVDKALDSVQATLCNDSYNLSQLANGISTNVMQGNNATQMALMQGNNATQMAILQGNNALSTQFADCCCKNQQNALENRYAMANEASGIKSAIADSANAAQMTAMQNRFDAAQNECATLQAIDKVGDRIIDYLANAETQRLRDENQSMKLVEQLRPAPVPAFSVPSPYFFGGMGMGNCPGCAR